jgi:iron complex transport system substrate-binding protein
LSDIYTDIATIAGIVGASEQGWRVIDSMRRRMEEVRKRVDGTIHPRVFCEEWGKPIIASQQWVAELVEAAGGEFLGNPGRPIPAEDVLRLDPEVFIAAWCGAGDRVPLQKIVADRGWQTTSAQHHGRVYCIRDELLNTPAPTLLHGLDALAYAIHPELFSGTEGIRQITAVPASAAGNSTS